MKPTVLKYAGLKNSVILIISPPPQPITVSIKHQNRSQETPTSSWHVYRFNNCLPNVDGILLVHCTAFFSEFILDMSSATFYIFRS